MRRLYFKILVHWVLVVIVTEALAFGLFLFVAKDAHLPVFVESVGRNTQVARDYIETAVAGTPQPAAAAGGAVQDVVKRLGETLHSQVWVSDGAGRQVAASAAGVSAFPAFGHTTTARYEDVTIILNVGPQRLSHATIPVALGNPAGEKGVLHILTARKPGTFPHGTFLTGLILIGIIVAAIAFPLSRHITKPLKRLQDSALLIAAGDLSARVAVRGKDEIGQLGQAFNRMAETVERMVRSGRELTANVSHEMRSPLARIRIAGECLKESVAHGDTADAEQLLEGMWEDIAESDRMLGRILEYSRLDLASAAPVTTPVALAAIISGLLKAMRPLFSSRGVTVETELESDLVVIGDEELLRTACKNILENAARYTPEGGLVRVVLRVAGNAVVLEVTNSSPPLRQEDLERLFEPFYRGQGVPGDGSGLGLAITRKIVLLHGGEVGAANTPHGFQVRLRLPGGIRI